MSGQTFGALLRQHRISVGLSQNQLARQAGCDPAYVHLMERGARTQPRRPVILALAERLGLSDSQTDRLLSAGGLSTEIDWQTRAIRAESALSAIRQAFDDATGAEQEPTFIRARTG